MATNKLSPEDLAYYAQQQAAVRNTQAIGQKELSNAQGGADLTYAQKLQALGEKLTQQGNALPDKFAARGIQNSGIFNYGGNVPQYTGQLGNGGFTNYSGVGRNLISQVGGRTVGYGTPQLGAEQQFKFDSTNALNDVRNQQTNVDQGYGLKVSDLNNTANNQLQNINVTEAAQNAAQAAADAIAGGF